MSKHTSHHSKSTGQALAEFALVLPFLLAITLATFDFGRIIFTYTQASNALRNAVRNAQVIGYGTGTASYLDCTEIENAARDIFYADAHTVNIQFQSAQDGTVTPCATATDDNVDNGDMLQVTSSIQIGYITPGLSSVFAPLSFNFTGQRTVVKNIELGSDDKTDTDFDGLDDNWEKTYFGDLDESGLGDPDGDGCNNGCEETRGTNPLDGDTDKDGLTDRDEAYIIGTDPAKFDTDGDGLGDGDELNTYGTDPFVGDTDTDGLLDGAEVNGDPVYGFTSDPTLIDTDGDGLSDFDEVANGANPRILDTDVDGLNDFEEVRTYNSDPRLPDTDSDGVNDYDEAKVWGSNPRSTDSDGDSLLDGEEVNLYFSHPAKIDSDSDTLTDWEEIKHPLYGGGAAAGGLDPMKFDTDDDGLDDWSELNPGSVAIRMGMPTDPTDPYTDEDTLKDGDELKLVPPTNPALTDTDGDGVWDDGQVGVTSDSDADGLTDTWEIQWWGSITVTTGNADYDGDGLTNRIEEQRGTDPTKADTDGDGLNDGEEIARTTDPKNPDTDGDGLNDGAEVKTYFTNPKLVDTDGDGLTDPEEIAFNSDPTKGDTDGDGLNDAAEKLQGTDPRDNDTDNDGLTDGQEVNNYKTNPKNVDTDGDGLNDGDEVVTHKTDPSKADTDGDKLTDGQEINTHKTNPLKISSDRDTLSDYDEVMGEVQVAAPWNRKVKTDPLKEDTDGDGIWDDAEAQRGTLPNNPIQISINNVSCDEPPKNPGSAQFTFTLTLDKASVEQTVVYYETVDAAAEAANGTLPPAALAAAGGEVRAPGGGNGGGGQTPTPYDYYITRGTVTFAPGVTSRTVNVTVIYNETNELPTEYFNVLLSNAENSYIQTVSGRLDFGLGTITEGRGGGSKSCTFTP